MKWASSNCGMGIQQLWNGQPAIVEWASLPVPVINRAQLQNPELQLIPWLVEHHRSMGLVKAIRRRHRTNAQRSLDIWAPTLT